jgi:peptidoglycan/xylan/chitin deacetylase (PgdA/CDA1 family)
VAETLAYDVAPASVAHLSLTFDDGPDQHWTGRILAELAALDARATFFVMGARVQALPGIARAVIEAGHEIALHCQRHLRHTELGEAEIEHDTQAALDALARIGVRPRRWRTPWGAVTPATERVARRHDLALVRWTIDTHDWRGDSPYTMLAAARAGLAAPVDGEPCAGHVVLMHDGLGPGSRRADAENTRRLLAPLIAGARHGGMSVGALPGA